MKAIGLTVYGGPEVLQLVDVPDPHAGAGEVRVRVRAAAINPADVMLRDGSLAEWYADVRPPFVPGMDVAGVIDEVGAGVDPNLRLERGRAVVGVMDNHGQSGAYSEFVVLPAPSVTAVPVGASFPEAASWLMNSLTARTALDALHLPRGATVLVTGAGGAVGAYAVALAAADGLVPIAVAAERDAEFVLAQGAEGFISRTDDIPARVREIAPDGADAVIDAASLRNGIVAAVRDGGQIIDLRSWDAELERGIRIGHVNVRDRVADHAAISRLRDQVEAGLLPMRVAGVYPATSAAEAHARLSEGHLRGRLILTFADDNASVNATVPVDDGRTV